MMLIALLKCCAAVCRPSTLSIVLASSSNSVALLTTTRRWISMVEAVVRRTCFNPASDTIDAGAEVDAELALEENAMGQEIGSEDIAVGPLVEPQSSEVLSNISTPD